VAAKSVPRYLGVPKYRPEKTGDKDEIGVANGLAYTSFGGVILKCEVTVVPGKGELAITGLLEKGMKESAQAAMSYVRSRAKLLGIPDDFYQKNDYHIHFPEFIPKDGPSAGITMAAGIASALMKIAVHRNLAMTGEVTLRGNVLPIGGLKEKMLAAHRASITTVVIPKDNRKDLREIPRRVLKATRIVLVEHMDEVLREALCLSDADAVFGKRIPPMEYVNGELVITDQDMEMERDVPEPTVEPPGATQ
jgi:ATP-dependent Lon protease